MVTAAKIRDLCSRLEQVATCVAPSDHRVVTIYVRDGETPADAERRYRAENPLSPGTHLVFITYVDAIDGRPASRDQLGSS